MATVKKNDVAPAIAPAIASAQVMEIAIDLIVPTPDNPRVFPKDDTKNANLNELAASICAVGVLEPLLARPHPDKRGHYDLRAGERRWRAAQLARLKSVPVIVREMDDMTAALVTVTENKQREDLHPLEEARGINTLLQRGWTLDQVSAQLGYSRRHIARRAVLNNLTPKWREGVADNDVLHHWGQAHLEMIARMPANVQDEIFDDLSKRKWGFSDLENVDELRRYLGEYYNVLDTAPWKKDDETLVVAAGSCAACTKRSDCQAELFDDDDFRDDDDGRKSKKISRGARCLDRACWNAKKVAYLKNEAARLEAKHGKIALVQNTYGMEDESTVKLATAYDHEFQSCKKSEPGAVLCMRVDHERAGQTYWAKPASAGSSSRGSGSTSRPKQPGEKKSLAERRGNLEMLRSRIVTQYIIDEYEQLSLKKEVPKDYPTTRIVAALCVFGTNGAPEPNASCEQWKAVAELFVAGRTHEMMGVLFASLCEKIVSILRYRMIESSNYKQRVDSSYLRGACDFIGVEYDEIVERAKKDKPEPKAWAKEADDVKAEKSGKKPKPAKKTAPKKQATKKSKAKSKK